MKMTQKHRLIWALLGNGWVHFADLNRICFRYGARFLELRRRGFDIRHKQVDGAHYYLLATPRERIDFGKLVVTQ